MDTVVLFWSCYRWVFFNPYEWSNPFEPITQAEYRLCLFQHPHHCFIACLPSFAVAIHCEECPFFQSYSDTTRWHRAPYTETAFVQMSECSVGCRYYQMHAGMQKPSWSCHAAEAWLRQARSLRRCTLSSAADWCASLSADHALCVTSWWDPRSCGLWMSRWYRVFVYVWWITVCWYGHQWNHTVLLVCKNRLLGMGGCSEPCTRVRDVKV